MLHGAFHGCHPDFCIHKQITYVFTFILIVFIVFFPLFLSLSLFIPFVGTFRKRMRCTTNIYLTALAITDIAYLTFSLILSLKHYEYIKYHCELYWSLYGFIVWLCDACGK